MFKHFVSIGSDNQMSNSILSVRAGFESLDGLRFLGLVLLFNIFLKGVGLSLRTSNRTVNNPSSAFRFPIIITIVNLSIVIRRCKKKRKFDNYTKRGREWPVLKSIFERVTTFRTVSWDRHEEEGNLTKVSSTWGPKMKNRKKQRLNYLFSRVLFVSSQPLILRRMLQSGFQVKAVASWRRSALEGC